MDDQEHARNRRHIIVAMLRALDHPAELLRICGEAGEDAGSLGTRIADAFGCDLIQADAILSMQVRRFTPATVAQLRGELADIDRLLGS